MLALCLMLSVTYYAQNHASIIGLGLYISKKMEHFSYKGGCGIHGCMHIETFLKEQLA